MNKPTFYLRENEDCIELSAFGQLSVFSVNTFRLHLLKLLQYGKSKSFKLNLSGVASIDDSCVQLIHILNRELTAVNATLIIEMPEEQAQSVFLPSLS